MAVERDNRLFIVVDPGFDSIKVLINGYYLKFPKEVVDITDLDDTKFLGKKTNTYIKACIIDGKQHLVGEYAAKFLADKDSDDSDDVDDKYHDSYSTFKTSDKKILILSAIAKGLINYALNAKTNLVEIKKVEDAAEPTFDVNICNCKVFVAVAMPHGAVDAWSYVESWLKGKHEYKIETKEGIYNINIDTTNSMVSSQVISALYGVLTDDEGALPEEGEEKLNEEHLPAIVIDGGYLTLGIAHFTTANLVDESESNQTFAMRNIYENVAARIREESGRTDVTSVMIKQTMKSKIKEIHYEDVNEEGHTIDVSKIVVEETRKVCEALIANLKERYKKLVNIKTIIVTGGTGMIYYDQIKELLAKSDWINVMLTDYEFYGEDITPDYAIVVGTYKVLHAAVDELIKAKGKR
jgi:hypothetical protein